MGVGVLLTGIACGSVGVGYGVGASRKYAETSQPAISQLEAARLTREADDATDRGNYLVLAGLALGLAGGVLILVDVLSPNSSDPSLALVPTDGGAVAAFGLRW